MLFTVVEGDQRRARSCSCCSTAARRSGTRPRRWRRSRPRSAGAACSSTRACRSSPRSTARRRDSSSSARSTRRGAVRRGAGARLAHGLRRCPRALRDAGADPERRRARRRMARGGVRADRARPRHGGRRADARPEVRRAGARGGAAHRRVLRRRDRRAADAGDAPRGLVEAGLASSELARLHGPAGLDIGADIAGRDGASRSSREALAVRAGRDGGVAAATLGSRIHVET